MGALSLMADKSKEGHEGLTLTQKCRLGFAACSIAIWQLWRGLFGSDEPPTVLYQAKVLYLGLNGAGKTHIVEQLRNVDGAIEPTNGFKIQELDVKQFKLALWEVGGGETLRPYWHKYAQGISGLIYVIDVSDKERFEESAGALRTLFTNTGLQILPTLFVLNDHGRAPQMTAEEVRSQVVTFMPPGNPF